MMLNPGAVFAEEEKDMAEGLFLKLNSVYDLDTCVADATCH